MRTSFWVSVIEGINARNAHLIEYEKLFRALEDKRNRSRNKFLNFMQINTKTTSRLSFRRSLLWGIISLLRLNWIITATTTISREKLASRIWVPVSISGFRFYPSSRWNACTWLRSLRPDGVPPFGTCRCDSNAPHRCIWAKTSLKFSPFPWPATPESPINKRNLEKAWKKWKNSALDRENVLRLHHEIFFSFFLQSISWEARKLPNVKLLWIIIDVILSWHDSSKRACRWLLPKRAAASGSAESLFNKLDNFFSSRLSGASRDTREKFN